MSRSTHPHSGLRSAHRWLLAGTALLVPLYACSSGGGGDDTDSEASNQSTEDGLSALNTKDVNNLDEALQFFEEALDADPQNDLARILRAFVRLMIFLGDWRPETELGALIAGYGVDLGENTTLFDYIDGEAPPPTLPEELPQDSPHSGQVQSFLAGALANALREAADDLELVDDDFSRDLSDLLGEPAELDVGDVRLMEAALRGLIAVAEAQAAIDLNADVDQLVEWEARGLAAPYSLYNGRDPMFPEPGLDCSGRLGFLNESAETASSSTFLPTDAADDQLETARDELVRAIDALIAGVLYADVDSGHDLIYIDEDDRNLFQLADDWLQDVQAALEGDDPNVVERTIGTTVLPGFVLRAGLALSGDTYRGRFFVPDTTAGDPCTPTAASFAHALSNPDLMQLVFELTGENLTGQDLLDSWLDLSEAWDAMFQPSVR